MNLLALEKAQSRLRLTRRAATALQTVGEDPIAFEDHWTEFLVHWKGAYTKVQQAAKDTPQELQWFGGVNRERKNDPLLRWLFEARNDEEHGLVRSAVNRPELTMVRLHEDALTTGIMRLADGSWRLVGEDGKIIEGDYGPSLPAESSLQPVKERNGTVVPPPTSHMSNPMEPKPLIAALLGAQWLESLVKTAEGLRTP
jgi:hypothetical protein